MKVYWLNETETAIESVTSYPSVLGNISNPSEADIRAKGGRVEIQRPAYDTATQYLGSISVANGELEWPVIDYTPEELFARGEQVKEQSIAAIWQAAHDYEFAQISGSAVGLLTAGVLQSLPKSLAVQGWIASIWNQYYMNKGLLEGGQDYTEAMLDYSAVGDIPHTVPELRAEIGL